MKSLRPLCSVCFNVIWEPLWERKSSIIVRVALDDQWGPSDLDRMLECVFTEGHPEKKTKGSAEHDWTFAKGSTVTTAENELRTQKSQVPILTLSNCATSAKNVRSQFPVLISVSLQWGEWYLSERTPGNVMWGVTMVLAKTENTYSHIFQKLWSAFFFF